MTRENHQQPGGVTSAKERLPATRGGYKRQGEITSGQGLLASDKSDCQRPGGVTSDKGPIPNEYENEYENIIYAYLLVRVTLEIIFC